ncbi:MAG: TlyA family RNA methyltransferase [Bacteriovoracaceae bacterium]
MKTKDRLDKQLVTLGLSRSRSHARDLIQGSKVRVKGLIVTKPGHICSEEDVTIEELDPYVGRGAHKLETFLDEFLIDFKDKTVADIGASTGGFTEVALLRGAKKVYAIDVGSDQLDAKLRNDSRVMNLEKVNAKDLSILEEKVDLIVSDLSFISLNLVVTEMSNIIRDEGLALLLFKPQFEVGKKNLNSKGIVTCPDEEVLGFLNNFLKLCFENHFELVKAMKCLVKGKTGNQEYFLLLKKNIMMKDKAILKELP